MKAPFFLTSAAFYKLAQLIALLIFIMLNSSAAYARKEAPPKPIFKLIQGQGTEVCEAYLQRLNATEFLDNNPVKGTKEIGDAKEIGDGARLCSSALKYS